MRLETVIEAVNKLSTNYDTYTPPELKEQRIKLLSDAFKHKQDSNLKSAVDKVIHDENIKKFPTLAQLENYMPTGIEKDPDYCNTCERTGYYNVWQLKQDINKYYSIAYACKCNKTAHGMTVIDDLAIPIRAHNPYPPKYAKHNIYNQHKEEWSYKPLDNETFKALVYSHKMKNVLKSVN